jgi:hypothetical protein
MRIPDRFFGLSIQDQRLLLYSLAISTLFKFALRWFSLKTILFFSTRVPSVNAGSMSRTKGPAERVAWAVSSVARRIPTLNNCLAADLSTKFLLNPEERQTVVRIEGAKGHFGQLKAHVRLESESGLLIVSAEGDRNVAAPLWCGGSA